LYNEELGYLPLLTKYCSGGQIKEGERVGRCEEKRNEYSCLVGEGERNKTWDEIDVDGRKTS
jgi:hypothetical protein